MLKYFGSMVFFYFLIPLRLDTVKKTFIFFSHYISTRITCFGALALVTCCCILGYQQPFTLELIYLFSYLLPEFGLKDLLDFTVMYCSTISKRYFCTLVQMYSFFFPVDCENPFSLGNKYEAESGLFSSTGRSSKFLICPLDMSIFKCNVVQILAYLKPRS